MMAYGYTWVSDRHGERLRDQLHRPQPVFRLLLLLPGGGRTAARARARYSDEVCEFTAGAGSAPSRCSRLARLSAVSSNRVTITWDPPANDGGRPVSNYVYEKITPFADEFEYNCEYHPNDREHWTDACKMVSAGTRSATFSNLEPGASYKFRVRAVTSYSHGDWAIVEAHLPGRKR